MKFTLELQKEFGLRREEAIKFKPHQADHGNYIELQASWTKGGIQRIVPITTDSQRVCLDKIKQLIDEGESLIHWDKDYRQQKYFYNNHTRSAGLRRLHGLRHAYAQNRYEAIVTKLTKGHGWKCPYQGGPHQKDLNEFEKMIDNKARMALSRELGHSRVQIVKSYLGV